MSFKFFLLQIIFDLGGLTGITVLFFKFWGNTFAERLSAKYELKLNEKLEQFKSTIENSNYVNRAKFDAVYSCRYEISEALASCFSTIKTITPVNGIGIEATLEISQIEKEVKKFNSSLAKNISVLDEKIYNDLFSLIEVFNCQISSYKILISETDDDDLNFFSREELESKEKAIYNVLRQYYRNLQIEPDIC